VDVQVPLLKPGAFDAQQVLTVPQAKLVTLAGSNNVVACGVPLPPAP
jgi:hypothetical protein